MNLHLCEWTKNPETSKQPSGSETLHPHGCNLYFGFQTCAAEGRNSSVSIRGKTKASLSRGGSLIPVAPAAALPNSSNQIITNFHIWGQTGPTAEANPDLGLCHQQEVDLGLSRCTGSLHIVTLRQQNQASLCIFVFLYLPHASCCWCL